MNHHRFRFGWITVLTIGCLVSTASSLQRCGVERWSVKTGTDSDAQNIDLSNPKPAAIADLIALSAPSPIPKDNRVSPTETTVFVVNATLTDYKLESGRTGDSDYHLVLEDDQGNTMVAEIPSPDCVSDSSPFAAQIANARSEFDAQLTASSSFQTANIPVQVTGVGMFDFPHGQHGAAPNVIELHPVLDIVFNPNPTPSALAARPDFALAPLSAPINLLQGGSTSVTITTSSLRGDGAANAAISVSGLPGGVTAHVTPLGKGKAVLALKASAAAPTGTFPFMLTGAAGGKSHSQAASVIVSSAPQSSLNQEWEYMVVPASDDQDMVAKANKLGADDWEMVNVVKEGTKGWKAFFKRPKRDY